jgi:structural maintenance of chromosome 3 (chondroitin sulfate proteoglycan 6)
VSALLVLPPPFGYSLPSSALTYRGGWSETHARGCESAGTPTLLTRQLWPLHSVQCQQPLLAHCAHPGFSLQGFKSYLSLLDLEEFSPHYNVVVGRNGSGKSNLFAALQFVLSDEFGTLNPDQRQMLLHEGSGKEVFTAFVEIVFDNSDERMPIEGDEVTIRRTVGAKKDEYYLNGKHATKQDVANLLESAGFSRSNPYYIVQQGKIQELVTMSEEARLDLLKEVAGTRVYEERRAESVRIMDECAAKKEHIEDMLQNLAARLDELEQERAELQEFQKLDLTKRSLQYAIYEKDRERAQSKLVQIEQQRDEAALAVQAAEQEGSGVIEGDERLRQAVKAAQVLVAQLQQEREGQAVV